MHFCTSTIDNFFLSPTTCPMNSFFYPPFCVIICKWTIQKKNLNLDFAFKPKITESEHKNIQTRSQNLSSGNPEVSKEPISILSFDDWCEFNNSASDTFLFHYGLSLAGKVSFYDLAFRNGYGQILSRLEQPDNFKRKIVDPLNLEKLKTELDALRAGADLKVLGNKELGIANLFQHAISQFPYESSSCHTSEIISNKRMGCVGASLVGTTLLNEVGIRHLVGKIDNHVLLILVTSDGRVFWQDMKDGKKVSVCKMKN